MEMASDGKRKWRRERSRRRREQIEQAVVAKTVQHQCASLGCSDSLFSLSLSNPKPQNPTPFILLFTVIQIYECKADPIERVHISSYKYKSKKIINEKNKAIRSLNHNKGNWEVIWAETEKRQNWGEEETGGAQSWNSKDGPRVWLDAPRKCNSKKNKTSALQSAAAGLLFSTHSHNHKHSFACNAFMETNSRGWSKYNAQSHFSL